MEFLDIINEQDEVIDHATREEIYAQKQRHRIVHLFVYNSQGELALQQRSPKNSFMPMHWGTSAGGHVQHAETYEQAIHREAQEELGIAMTHITRIGSSDFITDTGIPKILTLFSTVHEGPFMLDPHEGASLSFFPVPLIQKMARQGERFMPELSHLLSHHFSIHV